DAQRTSVDMGCGTGVYALHAARYYRNIGAGDVSRAMLECAHPRAGRARLTNIALDRGGFLTCDAKDESVDAIVSVAVLHDPRDFWKLVGLRRLAAILKPDGRFYLLDVVLSFDVARYESRLRQFVESLSRPASPAQRAESQARLRDEYRIGRPIIEGLFERAGLQRETADVADEFLAVYSGTGMVTQKSAVGLDV
ncbi:MAG: class I SAM-dependent methyltransferase, partial [Sedimentisphaerales bacterium]|nr:class I SAM-dependent methyltransferase [Sedimentisphaerales bacterium]